MTPEPIAEEILLADTRWLHGLLERLVGDRHVAEDLHQEALLAAWAHGANSSVTRSWLSRVARNLAVSFRRSASRRARAEGGLPDEHESHSPPELIMEAELQGRAVEAVLSLDEPYRKTVLLRYMKGRSLEEVAGEMAVPTETVRTRQRRALELLRAKLGVRARRRAWLPIAWPGWVKGTGVITMVMSKKSAFAFVSVLAMLAVGWLVVPLPNGSEPPTVSGPSLAFEPVTLENETAIPNPPAASSSTQRSEISAPRTGTLEVLVSWTDTGDPVESYPMRLAPDLGLPGILLSSDTEGVVRWEGLQLGTYLLQAIRPNVNKQCQIRAGEITQVEISVDGGLQGIVTVVDTFGEPVEGALVVNAQGGVLPAWTYPLGRTDAQGQLAFRGMHGTHILGATSETLGTSPFLILGGEVTEDQQTRPITLTLPGTAGSISGRVFAANGEAIGGAVVIVDFGYAGIDFDDDHHWWPPPAATTHTDEDGAFALTGLRPMQAKLVVIDARFSLHSEEIDLANGPIANRSIVLEGGGVIEGRITDELGQAIPSASCEVTTGNNYGGDRFPRVAVDGTFRLDHVPSGAINIVIKSTLHKSWEEDLEITDGASHQINAVLARISSQRCRLVDADGKPLVGWWFNRKQGLNGKTDYQGFFDLAMPAGQRESLYVWNDWKMGPVIHTFGPINEQSALVTLILPNRSIPSAWLIGRVLGDDAAQLAGISMRITQHDVTFWGRAGRSVWPDKFETDAEGIFRIGPLPPGRYSLKALHANLVFPPLEVSTNADEEHDVGSMQGVPSASLTLIPSIAAREDRSAYILLDADGQSFRPRRGDSGPLVFGRLYPGTYKVGIVEDDRHRILEEVTLLAGDVRELRLTAR